MTTDDTQQAATHEEVGQQLKQAREKLGLSISQIADAQHLRNGIIQAIENSEFSQIGSELFLKGYVRAYAKQVGLDGNTIIADLDRELEPSRIQKAQELEANPLVDIERRRRKKRRVAKLFLLVAVAIIIGAFVVMFVMPRFGVEAAGGENSTPAKTSEKVEEVAAPVKEAEAPALATEGEAPTLSSSEPVASSTLAPTAGGSSAEPQAEQVAEAEVEDQIPVVPQITEPALAKPPVSDQPGSPSGKLEIEFSGNCWVQVRDASGKRLASSMKRAGERLEISGEAPFEVVIGAVDTVKSIRFQGEIVDIGEFPAVNNRSEFTLAI